MQKDKAFAEIHNLTFPSDADIDNDYRFDISPQSFSDDGCFVYAVSNGKQVRIMASKLNYIIEESRSELKNINISDGFIVMVILNGDEGLILLDYQAFAFCFMPDLLQCLLQ